MNILIVSPKFHPIIGGGETYVINSINRLQAAGLNVSIAVEPNTKRQLSDYPYNVYEIEGLSDTHLDIVSTTTALHNLILHIKPDIIHVHGYQALLVIGLCNPGDIPIVTSIHSTPVWGERIIGVMDNFEAELQFARKVLALAKPQLLTAANKVYAEAAKRIVGSSLKVAVLPYPVDSNLFQRQNNLAKRNELGMKGNSCLIMTPSRIIERKGIKEIILALSGLPDNFYLCLPGAFDPLDKAYWANICNLAEYKKNQHRIIIPEHQVLYNDMPLLYAASDIIVMPSYYEGAPVATVEAMASGKPFVGADSQGINSFIRHERNGLLVPKRTVNELAAAIYRLSQDSALRNKLTHQARQDILYLSWDKQLPLLINLYDKLLEPKKQVLGPSVINY